MAIGSLFVTTMRHKARENFNAATRLRTAKCANAVANRAYYSYFQACMAEIDSNGLGVPTHRQGYDYYEHRTVRNNLRGIHISGDEQDLYFELHDLRNKADYGMAHVNLNEIDDAMLENLNTVLVSLGV